MRVALPLPPPQAKTVPGTGARVDGRRGIEGARATPFDDKISALRAYWCMRGLCHMCGERWSRDHRCVSTVQLHVVEELWELLQCSETDSQRAKDDKSQIEADLIAISKEAVNGAETSRTIRLQGVIQSLEVIMLVDSGSSHCFVSEELARQMAGS